MLREASGRSSRKLHDVAQGIVDSVQQGANQNAAG
jgi:hypothetical protein